MSLAMSPEERDAFLADLHVGVISIEQAGAAPLTVPIWYDYKPGAGGWIGADAGGTLPSIRACGRCGVASPRPELGTRDEGGIGRDWFRWRAPPTFRCGRTRNGDRIDDHSRKSGADSPAISATRRRARKTTALILRIVPTTGQLERLQQLLGVRILPRQLCPNAPTSRRSGVESESTGFAIA